MGNKIQGEGDYEAGRRFQKEEQEFVKRKFGKRHALDDLKKDDLKMDDAKLDDSKFNESEEDTRLEADALDDDDDTQIANNRGVTTRRMDDHSPSRR